MALLSLAAAVAVTVALVLFSRYETLPMPYAGALILIILTQALVVWVMTVSIRRINNQMRKERVERRAGGKTKK